MKHFMGALLAMCVAAGSGAASAATLVITQTDNGGSYGSVSAMDATKLVVQAGFGESIPVFDTALGTLNSVYISIDEDDAVAIDIARFASDPALATLTLPLYFSTTLSGPVGSGQSGIQTFYLPAGKSSDTISYESIGGSNTQLTGAQYLAFPSGLTLLDSLDLELTNANSTTLGITASAAITVNTTKTFTFDYTPFAGSVPEPAAWALMILGMGMVGATLRSRQPRARVIT